MKHDMKNVEHVYASSEDQEIWNNSDLNDVVVEYVESNIAVVAGDELTVYQGVIQDRTASSYLPHMFDPMSESIYDEVGEAAADWPEGDGKEFQKAIEEFTDDWFTENKMQPTAGLVDQIEPIKVLIKSISEGSVEWEEVTIENT